MSTKLEAIVERQMRNWELSRRQSDARPQREPPEDVQNYIAISRQLGSGGYDIAHRLGRTLGWQVYGREILDYMAEQDTVQRRIYALQDERHETWLESIMNALVPERPFGRDDYFHKLARAILTIARNESAIFLGRGAAFLLPPQRGLRVRIVAPLETCVANLAMREGLTLEEAEHKVRHQGRERENFIRAHFVPEPWAADHYDLVLNLESITPDAARAIIIEALTHKTKAQPC
jgi:cytidylate kinase